ncbi:hypothetical protein HY480_03235 [Candidatus Uhrbacteria bacterium]|nr:hypothetical protein [Candidatus Uhrbacteria bacterium]
MSARKTPVAMTPRETFHYRLLFKAAANMGGLKGLFPEVIRNAFFHGVARNVFIDIRRGARDLPELVVLDDGNGMEERGRTCFGQQLGYTTAEGTGSGGRLSAATICQIIEAVTVPAGDPTHAYHLTMHLPTFVVGVVNGTWVAEWQRMPRAESAFPERLAHGTMLVFRDFRASHADAPFDEAKMRDTSALVHGEEVRRIVPLVLPPDLARRVTVDGTPVHPPEIEGFPLWAMKPKAVAGLGVVSGDIRFSAEADGRWCTIGGTTSTILMSQFLDDCRIHNPPLAKRLPKELGDRRNAGFIRIEVLERYPTQGREHLDPAFYDSADAAAVVTFLESSVCPVIRAQRAEYERQPASEETRSALVRIAARLHHVQGVAPGTVPGGTAVVGRPEDQPIEVNRVTVRLEAVSGRDPADTGTFRILNPLPTETFTWDDVGAGVLAARAGATMTVTAVRKAGTYAVEVRSDQHPKRKCVLHVDVMQPAPAQPSEFLLVPMRTRVTVGDEKHVAIRSAGTTTGPYTWTVGCTGRGGPSERSRAFDLDAGGKAITFRPTRIGDYLVTCTDTATGQQATSAIEVLASAPVASPPGDAGGGGDGTAIGTDGTRPSPVAVRDDTITLSFHGVTFFLKGVPYIQRPWTLEPDNRIIFVSDVHPANIGARTPDHRDQHLSWCVASALAAFFLRSGAITPENYEEVARIHDEVLRGALIEERPPATTAAPAKGRPATTRGAPART